MLLIKSTLAVLSALFILQTALSFVRTRAWWVRTFDFPRPQIAAGSVVLLVLFGATNIGVEDAKAWEWVLLGLLGIAVAVQAFEILPYTRLWKPQVPQAPENARDAARLRIVISNVSMRNREVDRWMRTVFAENPDLVIAVEVDEWWSRHLGALSEKLPHHVSRPQDNTYGMALYSRYPLGGSEIRHLVEADVPSLFTTLRLRPGGEVRCIVLHPRPPRPDIRQDSSFRDAELVQAAREVRASSLPVIVAGDLNDVAWSHTTHLFQRIAGVLDPRIGRGLYATFSTRHRLLRFPLDHVFHSNHFDLVELRRLQHVGSDHFPMLVELALRRDDTPGPPPPETDRDDHAQARDAVEDAREERQNESHRERRERRQADR